jgi:hypothetical protein
MHSRDAANVDRELAELLQVLAKLGNALDVAFTNDRERNSPEDERARYIFALTEVSKFLHAATASRIPSKRFYDLAVALADLEFGRTDPLLKPSTPGTSASPTRIWCARARVAVVIHAFISAGHTREEAAKKVAGIFPEIDSLAAFERKNSSSPDWRKALNWYDQFKKANSKINPVARSIFELGSKTAPLGSLPGELQETSKKA